MFSVPVDWCFREPSMRIASSRAQSSAGRNRPAPCPASVSDTSCKSRANSGIAEFLLELLDALANRRLRAAHALGRAREAALLGDGQEVLELEKFHRDSATACCSIVETCAPDNPSSHQILAPNHFAVEHLLNLVHDLLANAGQIDLRGQVREDERLDAGALGNRARCRDDCRWRRDTAALGSVPLK